MCRSCVDAKPPIIDALVEPVDFHFLVRKRHKTVMGFFFGKHVNVTIVMETSERLLVVIKPMPDRVAVDVEALRHGMDADQVRPCFVFLGLQVECDTQFVQ